MNGSTNMLAIAGDISLFGLRAVTDAFRRPFEVDQIRRQLAEVGSKSLPLIVASGFALGAVLTLHTRGTLVTFGATAWIPAVQALAFFVELGPLVTGLLVAGRVGSGIGAVLSNMRATEQIDDSRRRRELRYRHVFRIPRPSVGPRRSVCGRFLSDRRCVDDSPPLARLLRKRTGRSHLQRHRDHDASHVAVAT
jgi:hypothetical protein